MVFLPKNGEWSLFQEVSMIQLLVMQKMMFMFFINIDIEARCNSGIFDPLMPPIASYIPGKVKSKGISASAKIKNFLKHGKSPK